MPTPPLLQEMESVVAVLARSPQGATLDQITAGLGQPLSKAKVRFLVLQLQRTLRIRQEGAGNGVLYFLAQSAPTSGAGSETPAATPAPTDAKTAVPSAAPAGAPPSLSDPATASAVSAGVPPPPPAPDAAPSTSVQKPVTQETTIPPPPPAATVASAGAPPDHRVPAALPSNGNAEPADARPVLPPSVAPSAPNPLITPAQPAPASATPPSPNPPPAVTPAASVSGGDVARKPPIAAASSGANEARFAELFDDNVLELVGATNGRIPCVARLQGIAKQELAEAADRRAFVAYGKTRLETLTGEEAVGFGLEPEQFERWHDSYFEKSPAPEAPTSEPAESDGAPGKKRRASSASTPTTPKGLAKLMAKWVDPLVPEEMRPYMRIGLVPVVGVILTLLLSQIRNHPWLTLGVLAAAILLMLFAAWFRAAKAAPGSTVDQSTGGSAADQPINRTSETPVRTVRTDRPVDSSTVIQSAPPRPRAGRFIAAAGLLAVVIIAIVAGVWYSRRAPRPSKADVSAWLTKAVAPLPVRVAALDLKYESVGSSSCSVLYDARLQTTESLYQAIDTTAYLRAHFPAELAAIDAAGKKLSQSPALTSRLASLGPAPTPAIADIGLIAAQKAAGVSTLVSGKVSAWQEGEAWVFGDAKVPVDRKELVGEAKAVLVAAKPAGAVFAVNLPNEATRLQTLIAEHAAYAAKVQAALTTFAADLERERQEKAEALAHLVQRGTWFGGVLVDIPQPDSHRVLLEVSDCSPTTHKLTLLLRNDSGWYNTRSAQGDWNLDADNETCVVKVWYSSMDRIVGVGHPLDNASSWSLTLRVRLDGTVAADPPNWDLHRIAPAEVNSVKAEFGYGRSAAASRSTVDPSNSLTVDQSTRGAAKAASGGSVDHKLGGSDTDRPVDRSTVIPSGASAGDSSTVLQSAPAAPALPAVATANTGAYVLDGQWLPLTRNHSQVIQSAPQKLTNALNRVTQWEDSLVGKATDTKTPMGQLTFDGRAYIPVVAGQHVVIAYVGPLTPIDDAVKARYPALKDCPLIELAPTKTGTNGTREAALYTIAPGFVGFGSNRVGATLEWVDLPVTTGASHVPALLLRCTTPLATGRYALFCGANSYEVEIK